MPMKHSLRFIFLLLLSTGSLRAVEVAALPAALSGFLEKHCHVCHADDEAESGLDLAGLGQT